MVETILSNPIISEGVLPFVLIFTIVFAILQKSEILGKDKKQIDAMVALVFGLITITFAGAIGIINQLLPFLAVAVVMILVFLILVGSVHSGKDFIWGDNIKKAIIAVAGIAVIIAGLYFTGAWDYLTYKFNQPGSNLMTNVIFIAIIIGGLFLVLRDNKEKPKP
jgi:hypothetical protein